MNIDKKFHLVCLQLIIVLLMLMNVEGMPNVHSLISSNPIPVEERGNQNERAYRLFNQCAFKEILVHDKVSTSANHSDERGDLVLETRMKGNDIRIRIRGRVSNKYLCYNRRGKLVAKPKARGAKCEFMEVPSGQYWSYKSVLNPRWFIGFDPKGRPLFGSDHVVSPYREDCFRFAKNGRYVDPQTPPHLLKHQFDVDEHNRLVGQAHPHRTAFNPLSIQRHVQQQPLEDLQFEKELQQLQQKQQPRHSLRHNRNQGKSHHPHLRHSSNIILNTNSKNSSSINFSNSSNNQQQQKSQLNKKSQRNRKSSSSSVPKMNRADR